MLQSLCWILGNLVDFDKDLETLWWQHLALGLSEAQRGSPAWIDAGGSKDISLTSGHGCHSRNASSIHREGLPIDQTKSVPVVSGLCPPVPRSGDGWPCPLHLLDTQLAPTPAWVFNSVQQEWEMETSVPFHPALPKARVAWGAMLRHETRGEDGHHPDN